MYNNQFVSKFWGDKSKQLCGPIVPPLSHFPIHFGGSWRSTGAILFGGRNCIQEKRVQMPSNAFKCIRICIPGEFFLWTTLNLPRPRFAGFSLVFAVLSIVLVVAGRRIFRGSLAPASRGYVQLYRPSGFHQWGYSHSCMVYTGKSHLEMDDDWRCPYFRKPPFPEKM